MDWDSLGAHRYIDAIHTVPGWIDQLDALLFVWIHESQQRAGIVGDILEIGVSSGRSAILLGYFRQPGERFVACDLFVGDTSRAFRHNYLRFHPSLPDIRVGPSRQLIDERVDAFRFIHVDGSHTFDDVRNDIEIASRLAEPGGVVVFDDIRAREYPGVAAAVWRAVATHALVPVALSNKLYCTVATRPDYLDHFAEIIRDDRSLLETTSHVIEGYEVLSVSARLSSRRRAIYDLAPPALLRIAKRLRR
jgi:predicted O-methyltransferase YrrM